MVILIQKKTIEFKQNNATFYLLKLTGQELLDNTEISHFNPDNPGAGYQRPPFPAHYRKISKYLLDHDSILPPAIITAIESDEITYKDDTILINKKIRVVDGQHRIEGIRHLKQFSSDKYDQVIKYEFPIILMSIGPTDKIHEVSTFIHLNKRGKKVSTDLAVSLAQILREQKNNPTEYSFDDMVESIATRISQKFEADSNGIWYRLISVGNEATRKPVSINLFNKSLYPLISNYLNFKGINKKTPLALEKHKEDQGVEYLSKLIQEAWAKVILKWKECFLQKPKIGYFDKYNIQKGIGVNSLHILLTEAMIKAKNDNKETMLEFQRIINESDVSYSSWRTGGRFSVYNSKAGFEKIAKIIKNEPEIEEDDDELSF